MRVTLLAAVLAILVLAEPAEAQFGPFPSGPMNPVRGHGSGRSHKHVVVIGFVAGGPVLPVGYYPAFGYGYPVMRSGIIVVLAPPVAAIPSAPRGLPPLGDSVPLAKEKEAVPFDPDGVLVIRPREGGLKNLPPAREAPPAAFPPRLPEPPPKVAGFEPPARIAPPPDPDADAENERQNKLGREAFTAGEFGRAADRFEQAIRVAPQKPMSYFLMAQAQFALGKFRDATASILAGMKLQPEWPAAKFNLRELFGDHAAEYAVQMERLRAAVTRNPDEPALSFLLGHQLWFTGSRDEAKAFFRKAIPLAADPKPIERFLAELDGKMVVG